MLRACLPYELMKYAIVVLQEEANIEKNLLMTRMDHGIGGYLPIGKAIPSIKAIPFKNMIHSV